MKYAISIISLIAISSTIYAFNIETDPQVLIERENREKVLDCMENVHSSTGTARVLQEQIEKCAKIGLQSIIDAKATTGSVIPVPERSDSATLGDNNSGKILGEMRCPELYMSGSEVFSPRYGVTWEFTIKEAKELYPKCKILDNAKATTGSVIPEPPKNKTISLECEFGERSGKVEGIEFHYTATDDTTTLQSIKNSHIAKGQEHIGYHFVIKANGEVTNTRDERCVAGADKWAKNNYRFIQIAFVGDDKPTYEQTESMAILTKDLQIKYKLPIDSISAHSEWGPKSKKESLEYWYGSKAEFIKKIRYYYVISIYGEGSVELQYMWRAWGDKDFIGTIFQESRMSNTSVGDGGQSIGYCQIHKGYQPGWYAEYSKLQTMEARLNYCHELYAYSATLPGGVGSRFHGYNARSEHINNLFIQ